jgi:flagellar hook-associated protein 1 FlgK
VADIFGISVSALQAFQTAISVTSNNIANANTPGYNKESVNLTAAAPQSNGSASVGAGVVVNGVVRSYSQATVNQLNSSQSSLGQLNALQSYANQIDNLFGTTAGGLSTALQTYYSAWSDVANNPTSTAARQALLDKAQSLSSSFQNSSSQLDGLNADINSRITADVQQINSLTASISKLNTQIVVGTAQAGGQAPNELLDQRDQLISQLSKLTSISTTTDSNGAVNVFFGNGQPLVLQGTVTALTTQPNQFNSTQLEVASVGTNGANFLVSNLITGGDLGGLLAARSQVVDPATNQLGQIAVALNATANLQQASGLDLSGQFGAALFAIGAPLATASSKNTDATTATASITNVGALTANDYLLSYAGGQYSLVRASDGSTVALAGAGTAQNPLTAEGLSIVLSGTPAAGDQFLIQPTAQAAGSFRTVLSNPSQLAAAAAIKTAAANSNTGSATISAGTVINPANANLLTAATIQFTSPTTYSINGAGNFPYTSGANITANGWQVAINGTPAANDTFTVQGNAGGTGDNRNALASANQQSQLVLTNGTASIGSAVSGLITGIGSQVQQINTAQAAQAAVTSQAQANLQSVSGVNLDEEAASLLQWQQAYQAAAQALKIGSSLFQNLLTAVQAA